MSKHYQVILGTLGYVLSKDKKSVLLIHRNARKDDEHLGKYNGLGGKLEANEDIITGMKREIKEESGLEVQKLSLRGTINWPGFGVNGENWFGYIFLISGWSGEPFTSNDEGDLLWVDLQKLEALPMWEGDRHFLPLIFDEDPRIFHGVMPYHQGKLVGWSFIRE